VSFALVGGLCNCLLLGLVELYYCPIVFVISIRLIHYVDIRLAKKDAINLKIAVVIFQRHASLVYAVL